MRFEYLFAAYFFVILRVCFFGVSFRAFSLTRHSAPFLPPSFWANAKNLKGMMSFWAERRICLKGPEVGDAKISRRASPT